MKYRETLAAKVIAKAKAKREKARRKLRRKVKRNLCAIALLALVLAGCQQIPSRSQTLTVRDCTITVYGGGATTNCTPAVEVATQAMAIENSGTESITPTNDVKPALEVSVPVNKAGAAQTIGSAIGDAVAGLITGTTTSTTTTKTDCPDGNCSE